MVKLVKRDVFTDGFLFEFYKAGLTKEDEYFLNIAHATSEIMLGK